MYQYYSKSKMQSEKSKENTPATNKNHLQIGAKMPMQTKSLFSPSVNQEIDREKSNLNQVSRPTQLIPLRYSPLQTQLMPKQEQREIQPYPIPIKMSESQDNLVPIPAKPNNTGIPLQMKERFESLSGFSFNDVRVHYNSDKPAQLQALAYTQGNQVHIGPGQEKHLGHELGHVVQQKEGRVQPTTQIRDVKVNDNSELEREADVMWKQPIQYKKSSSLQQPKKSNLGIGQFAVQRVIDLNENIGLTQEFIDGIKTISDEIRGVIEGWERKKHVMSFTSLDHFTDNIMAERVHDTSSDLLGLPINVINPTLAEKEPESGKHAALKLLGIIEDRRGIKGTEDDADVRIKFMIHRAAAGVVTGVAVCDNYASLNAVIMRIIGLSDVRLKGVSGHKTASAEGILVDPWTDLVHGSKTAQDEPSTDDILTINPEDLEARFYEEIETCKRLLPDALAELEEDQVAYYGLMDNRQRTGLGKMIWRKQEQERKEARTAAILEKRRKK